MVSKTLFSRTSDEWETPQDLFDQLNEEFQFELDACASFENNKCESFYTLDPRAGYSWLNGLNHNWYVYGSVFLNPPYSEYPEWIKKAYSESQKGCTVVCLIAARMETKIWHEIIFPFASEIRQIKGRLKFGNAKNSAPFPSAIVIFKPKEIQSPYKWVTVKCQ